MQDRPGGPVRTTATAACLAGLVLALTAASSPGTAEPSAGSSDPGRTTGPGSVATLSEPQTSSEGVEVSTHGIVEVHPYNVAANAPVYMAVHAVQRVEAGTVVYMSVGWPDGQEPPVLNSLTEDAAPGLRYFGGDSLISTRLAVPGSSVVLSTLPVEGASLARAFSSDISALPLEAGVMGVLYAVLPALPDGLDTVDVQLGFAAVVPDVPVGEGLLEPVSEGPVVPLGTGWPEIPADELAAPDQPELSILPLSAVTEAIDGSSRETATVDEVTIDISADVLFAFDSAELSPDAVARVTEVAQDVAARAAPGQLLVIGHTDSDGTDAYNDDLSQRRARSVADVLVPALGGAPLDPVVEGRGEREPVADNGTDEGKQQNRRVSVTFSLDPSEVAP